MPPQRMPHQERDARTRVARVNQKMIDRMIKLREQGFSYEDIGMRVGCSERTVRRHTKGVSPQLVHAADPTRVDLLQWGAKQFRAIQRRERLSVAELDLALRMWRSVVEKLDEMTLGQLELDSELRVQFLLHEVWPPIHEKIDNLRLIREKVPGFQAARGT
ncbi:MAG: hypothetical protein E6G45_13030 [Actinobacteria bacterium]|nr:MAG: hypothetical protein E6G45_13030 [Actinomycetota bacterium]